MKIVFTTIVLTLFFFNHNIAAAADVVTKSANESPNENNYIKKNNEPLVVVSASGKVVGRLVTGLSSSPSVFYAAINVNSAVAIIEFQPNGGMQWNRTGLDLSDGSGKWEDQILFEAANCVGTGLINGTGPFGFNPSRTIFSENGVLLYVGAGNAHPVGWVL